MAYVSTGVAVASLATGITMGVLARGFGRFSGPSTSTKEQFHRGCCEAFP